jgi:ABC-type spermidine/putrescine transport system permease subunit II
MSAMASLSARVMSFVIGVIAATVALACTTLASGAKEKKKERG